MNRKPCGYLASQLRVNPTRLNISLVLIKTHFSIRNSENFIKRRVADRWSQFLKSKISVFLSIQLLKISSNFSGLMSRVISTQLSRIMTIKKIWRLRFRIIVKAPADKYENLRAFTLFILQCTWTVLKLVWWPCHNWYDWYHHLVILQIY